MAVNEGMAAPQRRVVFGVNVLIQAALAAVLVVGVVWLSGRFKAQWDLTGTGRNSLSTRTIQLLKGLPQNIRITAVFAEPDKRDTLGQKRQRQLRDLLDLYEAAGGGKVTTAMIDPSTERGATDKLLQRLLELPAYKDEAKPHQEALKKIGDLTQQIKALANDEADKAERLAQADPQLARHRNFAIVRNNLMQVAREADDIQERIDELIHGEIPRYGQAVKLIREYVTGAEGLLQNAVSWMASEGLTITGLTPELKEFFEGAATRYQSVLDGMKGLIDQTKDLKDVKVEELYSGLTRWRTGPPVLVENEREGRVVPFWDLWVPPTDPGAPLGPDGDDRVFAGEAAISSAVLALTKTDKTAVIFTRFGGEPLLRPDFSRMNPMMQQMPRAPYQQLGQLLTKANFVTEEWDVSKEKTPPEAEGAQRKIYVVLPPEPPQQQDPRQPRPPAGLSPEDKKTILDAVNASGLAIFLAGFMPPTSPMAGAGTYEYADYLKTTWGVEVLYNYLTLHFMPHPERKDQWVPASRQPQLVTSDDVVRLTEHPIAAPLKADRAGFVLVAPLRFGGTTTLPAGVSVTPIAEMRDTKDAWAASDLMSLEDQLRRRQGVRPGDTDIRAPFPIAVAGENANGQKVVIFSSEHFASDAIAQASGLQQVGNALTLGPLYPANSDLLVNALHWLSGETERIAVGPRSGDVPRLKDLTEESAAVLPWLLVGVWPAVALVIGLGVWVVRRK